MVVFSFKPQQGSRKPPIGTPLLSNEELCDRVLSLHLKGDLGGDVRMVDNAVTDPSDTTTWIYECTGMY